MELEQEEQEQVVESKPGTLARGAFLKRAAVLGAGATVAGGLLTGPALGHGQRSFQESRGSGVHDRLNRISHWDVNVSDLERSRAWYEAVTPLRVVATTSAQQSFPSLGIKNGSFQGYMLRDQTQSAGFPMIHLVQWKNPTPVGTPYEYHGHVGHYRIVPAVADIAAARAACIAQGSEPFYPTTDVIAAFSPGGDFPYKVFTVHDPDGISLEFSQGFGVPITPNVIGHNTSDADRYVSFYTDALGLDFNAALQTPGPAPNVYSPGGGTTECDGALFGVRGNGTVSFDWLEWSKSREFSKPYKEPNHLGIIRASIQVDDVDAAFDALRRTSWAKKGRVILGPPEVWNYGPQFGTHKVLNFTDPEGVGFQFVEQTPPKPVKLHPWGFDSFPNRKGSPKHKR